MTIPAKNAARCKSGYRPEYGIDHPLDDVENTVQASQFEWVYVRNLNDDHEFRAVEIYSGCRSSPQPIAGAF